MTGYRTVEVAREAAQAIQLALDHILPGAVWHGGAIEVRLEVKPGQIDSTVTVALTGDPPPGPPLLAPAEPLPDNVVPLRPA